MKLLFDQNLAPRLVRDLADLFPSSAHVEDLGLESAPDQAIWNRARDVRQSYIGMNDMRHHVGEWRYGAGFPT